MGLQPVTDELFVVGRLALAGFVACQGPEPGAVGSEHFVTQDHFAFFVQAEFEFGVGDDDASFMGIVGAFLVQGDGGVLDGLGVFGPFPREDLFQVGDALFFGDVFVMVAQLCFGAGGEERFRELLAFLQPSGILMPQTVPFSL